MSRRDSEPGDSAVSWGALPAAALSAIVLSVGLGTALLQSLGLVPLRGEAQLSLGAYAATLTSEEVRSGVGVTLFIAGASTVLAVCVGLVIAVVVQHSRRAGRGLSALAAMTIPVSHLVGAAAIGLLLADSGLIARIVGAAPNTFPELIGGPWWVGVIAEYAWKESAFVAVVVIATLSVEERALDQAAAVLGAGAMARLRRVTLPLAAPALVISASISFAYVVGSYEVAWLLGRLYPEPLPVLAYRLFTDVDLASRPAAQVVALLTTAIAGAALILGVRLLRTLPTSL